MAQAVQPLVFRTTMLIDDTGGDLHRMESAFSDRVPMLDVTAAAGKYDVLVVSWAGEPVLAQCGNDHGRQRHRALTRL
jgi:hypothetical protein